MLSDKWQNRLVLEGVRSLLRATTGHMPGRPGLGPHSGWGPCTQPQSHDLSPHLDSTPVLRVCPHVLLHVTLTSPDASIPGPWRGPHLSFQMVN